MQVQRKQVMQTEQRVSVISGLAARYPMQEREQPASGTQHFWQGVCAGANLSSLVPLTRWDIDDVYSPDMAAKKMCAFWHCSHVCLSAGQQLRALIMSAGTCASATLWTAWTPLTRPPSTWRPARR